MHSKPREAQFVHGLARLHRVFLSLQLSHAFFTDGWAAAAAGPAGDLLTAPEAVTSFDVVGGDRDGDEFAIQTFQQITGTRQEEGAWSTLFSVSGRRVQPWPWLRVESK